MDSAKTTARRDKKYLSLGFDASYNKGFTAMTINIISVNSSVISKHMLQNKSMRASCEITSRSMLLNTVDYRSISVPVMVVCLQATSHCLRQCWPRFVSSWGVTRPPWVSLCQQKGSLEAAVRGMQLCLYYHCQYKICVRHAWSILII